MERQGGKKVNQSNYRIKVARNGPYIVYGGIPLSNQIIVLDSEGQSLEWQETKWYPIKQVYYLCRCGQTKNKPFCDGSHGKINFDGTETATHKNYIDQCQKFTGPNLDLTDAKPLCAHAAFCDRAGGIWNLIPRSDDPEARRIALEVGRNCPSGRLVDWDKAGQAIEPTLEPSIAIVEYPEMGMIGPIWVRGGIPIESVDGKTYEIRNRVTLCGCGKSSNKPFCDGTHDRKQAG
jgi:CDGSH-type Zn-finger protein